MDRLRFAKEDVQEVSRRAQSSYVHHPTPSSAVGVQPRNFSPPSALKRSADRWGQEDLPNAKQPRVGPLADETYRHRDNRRPSVDFMPPSGYSPTPGDPTPGSAYSRSGSPGTSGRTHRPLPSPSSLAYPPSAAPSQAPATAQSIDSPEASYPTAASIHSASTNSATSAHIADLQHQVTLKSLALSTLQSEYSSLLQKLQRERVKSQAIEKKSIVAGQEVNDLTTRNEDLSAQMKDLEGRLEECEKKRDRLAADYAMEKDQWGRMLEMGGKLHAKTADEVQKLKDEKHLYSQKFSSHGDGKDGTMSPPIGGFRPSSTDTTVTTSPDDVASLRREIGALQARVDALRTTLTETKLGFIQHHAEITATVDKVLNEDAAKGAENKFDQPRPQSATPKAKIPWPTEVPASSFRDPMHAWAENKRWHPPPEIAPSASSHTMTGIARAVSPGPAELGFKVTASDASPEELIRALGPVPTASNPTGAVTFVAWDGRSGSRGGREYKSGTGSPVDDASSQSSGSTRNRSSIESLSKENVASSLKREPGSSRLSPQHYATSDHSRDRGSSVTMPPPPPPRP